MTSAIDRARRDLSGTTIGFVGMSLEANPFRKYSNPDIRYLTYVVWVLLLKNKYVLESCYQRVQEYTVLCISLETITEFQVPRNRNPHGVLGSQEGNPELAPLWCA
jgi:hypothetical protein